MRRCQTPKASGTANASARTNARTAIVGVVEAGPKVTGSMSTHGPTLLTSGAAVHPSWMLSPGCPGETLRTRDERPLMTDTTDRELEEARAEIARLREENDQLRVHPPSRAAGWARSTAVVVLFALGFLLVPTAGLAVWGRNTLLNTDRYVETVAPLSDEPAVIDSVANRVTDAIFAQIDVEAELEANLPPRLAFAAGPITSQIESTTNDLVVKALETDQFDTLWREVNRQASEALVTFVKGDGSGAVSIQDGQLVLEIGPILAAVKDRLLEQGIAIAEKIPSTDASVPLPVGDVSYLEDARDAFKLLNTLAYILPWIAAACFIGAVLLSRDRRRGLVWPVC